MKKNLITAARAVVPVIVGIGILSVNASAASQIGTTFQSFANEATSVWAVSGTLAAAVIAGLAMGFGSHDMKGHATKLLLGSSVALGAQSILATFA
jgi:hypothetical protein